MCAGPLINARLQELCKGVVPPVSLPEAVAETFNRSTFTPERYISSGFLSLQLALEAAAKGRSDPLSLNVTAFSAFSQAEEKTMLLKGFFETVALYVGTAFCTFTLYGISVFSISATLALERESRLYESLKISGCITVCRDLAWAISFVLLQVISFAYK